MGILGAVVLLAPPSESRRGTDRPAPAALARDGLAGAGGSPPIFFCVPAQRSARSRPFPATLRTKVDRLGPRVSVPQLPPPLPSNGVGTFGRQASSLFALPRETPTQSGRCRSGTFTEISAKSPENEKRELVVSRFTLLGHLRPHAGKRGPFLLHGGWVKQTGGRLERPPESEWL